MKFKQRFIIFIFIIVGACVSQNSPIFNTPVVTSESLPLFINTPGIQENTITPLINPEIEQVAVFTSTATPFISPTESINIENTLETNPLSTIEVNASNNNNNDDKFQSFEIPIKAENEQDSPALLGFLIPVTGFPMNQVTKLSSQPTKLAYSSTDLWLEIPKLGVMTTIVGVPSTSQGWDVTWLGKNAGWLDGSAFPTWSGNSVITAHVWDALNRPGPFVNLKTLKYGDQVKIHAFGLIYIYEIWESTTISPNNVSAMLKHEEESWITLITCEDYKELSQTYSSRRMVRAVLVKVMEEN